jgi:FkbM family methyltransferase
MPVAELSKIWGLKPQGVLHVGAHQGEEAADYEDYGWLPVIWVEAQPDLVAELKSRLDPDSHKVLEAAIWNIDDVKKSFKKASNSQSSSLLDFGSHSIDYPSVVMSDEFEVSTKRLDTLLRGSVIPSFVNLDIQGVEGLAIVSLGTKISQVDAIYTEVNKREVYIGCTQIRDLDVLLKELGFSRVATRWVLGKGWGDALYLRRRVNRVAFASKMRSFKCAIDYYSPQLVQIAKNSLKAVVPKT